MKAARTQAAAELQAAIAQLKFQAEVEEFGMMAYLLGMAEEEARGIAMGEGWVVPQTTENDQPADVGKPVTDAKEMWRELMRILRAT